MLKYVRHLRVSWRLWNGSLQAYIVYKYLILEHAKYWIRNTWLSGYVVCPFGSSCLWRKRIYRCIYISHSQKFLQVTRFGPRPDHHPTCTLCITYEKVIHVCILTWKKQLISLYTNVWRTAGWNWTKKQLYIKNKSIEINKESSSLSISHCVQCTLQPLFAQFSKVPSNV